MKVTTHIALLGLMVLAGCASGGGMKQADSAFLAHDYKTALAGYQALAQQGDARADSQLALMYGLGLGVDEDVAEAQRWHEKAALDGSNLAAVELGNQYLHPPDQAPNYGKAFRWFKVAADRNDAEGQLQVSIFYEHGLGVAQDEDQAQYWLNRLVVKYSHGGNVAGYVAVVKEVLQTAALNTPEMPKFDDGVVTLSFHEQKGRAIAVKVIASSGHPEADAAACALLQKTLLPPVLASINPEEEFRIAFSFGPTKSPGATPAG
jgi:hypothetical protein